MRKQYYYPPLKELKVPSSDSLTPQVVDKLVDNFKRKEIPRMQWLSRYYQGQHDILFRESMDPSKPDNRIVHPFPEYITDFIQGYFLGKPVSYSSSEDSYMEALQTIFDNNEEQAHNFVLGKEASIHGVSYELLYVNEAREVKMAVIPSEEAFLVYNTSIEKKPVAGIRVYTVHDYALETDILHVEVYTQNLIRHYEDGGSGLVFTEEYEHFFGDVPLIPYYNSDEARGDFERVIPLIDDYNREASDIANDREYQADAYLVIKGAGLQTAGDEDADRFQEMKQNRVIAMDAESDASWLIKNTDSATIDSVFKRIRTNIHTLSCTPDMSDESFGSQPSGIAMRYKVIGLEEKIAIKERLFKKGLMERIRLITNFMNLTSAFEANDIGITFTRNLPVNEAEQMDLAIKMAQLTSKRTALSFVPGIDDVQYEIELLEEEQGMAYDSLLTEQQAQEETPEEGL